VYFHAPRVFLRGAYQARRVAEAGEEAPKISRNLFN